VAYPGRPDRSGILPEDPWLHCDRCHNHRRVTRDLVTATSKPASQAEAADEAAEPDLGRHPVALVAFAVAAAMFVGLFGILGAVLSGILFLGVTLWFLDREHHVRAVILAIGIPVLLYLAFQTGLNVGLPQGILPLG
jgi:putative tricarboxylic transport membrane protein